MELESPTAFSINGVRVDLSSESLRGPDGAIVPVRPQAFATLRYLLQNPDRLVTKTELMDVVWRNRGHRRQPCAMHSRNPPRPEGRAS
jgi:DNA-binding winged helix-turn-helix (wHTH) protein